MGLGLCGKPHGDDELGAPVSEGNEEPDIPGRSRTGSDGTADALDRPAGDVEPVQGCHRALGMMTVDACSTLPAIAPRVYWIR